MRGTVKGVVRICAVRSPYGIQEKREAEALREKEQEAPRQRTSGTSWVQEGLPRERAFVRKTSGEREIGCTRVKGEISSCKIFFS